MESFAAWVTFGAAIAAFLASHAIPARPPVRRWLTGLLGSRSYIILYSLTSFFLLGWVIKAATAAPFIELWPFAEWQRYLTALAVPVAFALGSAGLFTPNPLSLSASRRAFDSARPGILAFTRHPVLVAMALWAAAHLPPNGDLAHVIVFATFLLVAISGMFLLDRRARRRLGASEWTSLASTMPMLGLPRFAGLLLKPILVALAGAAAALVFGLFHEVIIGVPAFAP